MQTLMKSFKSQSSYKHKEEEDQEQHKILLHHNDDLMMKSPDSGDRIEVVANTNDSNNGGFDELTGSKIWREPSYDFWANNCVGGEKDNVMKQDGNGNGGFRFHQRPETVVDPPSKLIGQFLHKQKASGEVTLDMDLEMDELQHDRNLLPLEESPTIRRVSSNERRVSFKEPSPELVQRHHKETTSEQKSCSSNLGGVSNGEGGDDSGEVLKCSSNASFRRDSTLLRTKMKSRMMNQPDEPDQKSGKVAKSGLFKSGMLGKVNDEEEEDPFAEEDLPEEFKKAKIDTLTVLQWVSLILIIAALICSIVIPWLARITVWSLHIWKWEVLVLVLICGRLVSGWGIRIVVFFIERNFLLRKRVLYFVYGVRKAVQNCLWLGLVLIAWHFIFDKKVERETSSKTLPYVTKILVCLLVSTLIWLVKALLVKVLASSFHVTAFFDRIQESLFNQYVIETLSGAPLVEIQHIQEEEEKVVAEVRKLQNAGATMPADLTATAFPASKSGRVIGSGRLQKSPRVGMSPRFSGIVNKQKDEGITIDHLHKLNQKNISAWNMKRLMNIVRYGTLSTLDEQLIDSADGDDSATQIRNENEAKAAARKIFKNVAKPGHKCICVEDLMRFMREDESLKTISLFEGATETKRISKSALKNWVATSPSRGCAKIPQLLEGVIITPVSMQSFTYGIAVFLCPGRRYALLLNETDRMDLLAANFGPSKKCTRKFQIVELQNNLYRQVNAFRERKALALTLNDTKTAVNQLHHMVNILVGIIIVVIWLLILGIATTHLLVFISSQLLVVVFVFGNSCKMVFEAIIFLFVMHPFDVGDRCEVDGVQVVVEEMNILTTVFLRFDNLKIIYPNSVLATKPINNYYRSPDMGDSIDFCVHISTPAEKLAVMKQRIIGYIENKKEHWQPNPMVVMRDIEDMNRLKFSVWLTHRMNHQDMGERWQRRANLVEEMVKIFRELDIEYRMLPVDINARNMPTFTSTRLPSNWTACGH